MERFAKYSYNEGFTTLIKAQYERSVPEFAEKFGTITQVAAVEKIREIIPHDAICVGSAGSLPGDLQRMWTSDSRYSYNMEYGYSCMGYEIAGALGSKLAEPQKRCMRCAATAAILCCTRSLSHQSRSIKNKRTAV